MKKAVFKTLRIVCTICICTVVGYTQTTDIKDVQQAKQKLILGTDVSKWLNAIVHTISVASTNNQSPTAKAVYDYIQSLSYLATVSTTARLTGAGTSGSPLDIAQQGAATGQVLTWNGSAWVPSSATVASKTYEEFGSVTGTTITPADPLPAVDRAWRINLFRTGVRMQYLKDFTVSGSNIILTLPAAAEAFMLIIEN